MATVKQIEANRRNAQRSTGPKTEEGKARSRRNALKHGLSGRGVVLPEGEAEAVEGRAAEWHSSLRPFDAYQTWLLEVVAFESVRLDRCRAHEIALRDEQVRRAEEAWDEDRRREAEAWASRFAKDPGLAASRLRATVQGARLLAEWWEALGHALDGGDWSIDQEQMALDLLGVPEALRAGACSPIEVPAGRDRRAHRRGIAEEQAARLGRLIAEVLGPRDAREREAACVGLPGDDGPALARLRRYEASCLRRLLWARAQMRQPDAVPVFNPRTTCEPPRPAGDAGHRAAPIVEGAPPATTKRTRSAAPDVATARVAATKRTRSTAQPARSRAGASQAAAKPTSARNSIDLAMRAYDLKRTRSGEVPEIERRPGEGERGGSTWPPRASSRSSAASGPPGST